MKHRVNKLVIKFCNVVQLHKPAYITPLTSENQTLNLMLYHCAKY